MIVKLEVEFFADGDESNEYQEECFLTLFEEMNESVSVKIKKISFEHVSNPPEKKSFWKRFHERMDRAAFF